ncbi:acyltransferase [Klebsiella pneumoniae]|uniref:Acyltransferase n=1 Tax=Klebsiella pneumoniae TaxID=573 RepID=A0A3S5DI27_KLEPN|nr:acyltransferase [Klebsiella pneumoniae]
MNSTGLSIIKTLGCMTAVTFFTIYNTWDRFDYDYHWILGLLTFISTIATPLFFVVAGYLDAQTRHDANWQIGKIKSVVIVFLFWVTVYLCLGALPARLPDPALVYFRPDCHLYLSSFDRLAQPAARALFAVLLTLLCCSYGYDLLSGDLPGQTSFQFAAAVSPVDMATVLFNRAVV